MRNLLFLALLIVFSPVVFAARTPSIESRGTYLKITDGERISPPTDNDTPTVLYVRKSCVVSISVAPVLKSGDYRVILLTDSPSTIFSPSGDKVSVAATAKAYIYTFQSQSSAEDFCEIIASEKKG